MTSSVHEVRDLVERTFGELVTAGANREGGYDFRLIGDTGSGVRVVPTELGVNVLTFVSGDTVWLDAEAKFVGMATGVVAGVVAACLLAGVVL